MAISPGALTYAERKQFVENMVQKLDYVYTRAERELAIQLRDLQLLTPAQRNRANAIRRQVERIRKGLDTSYRKWAIESGEQAYKMGVKLADRALIEQGVKTNAFARVHQQSVVSIVSDMVLEMESAHSTIDHVFNRVIRRTQQNLTTDYAISRQVAEGLISGVERRATSDALLNTLTKKMGDDQFITINGRMYKPAPYARLVARTRTREAVTEGVKMMTVLNKGDLVQVSFHASTCPACEPYERRIYSISGSHPDFPALDVRPPFHPNCVHVLVPVLDKTLKDRGEYDQAVAKSNAPIPKPTADDWKKYRGTRPKPKRTGRRQPPRDARKRGRVNILEAGVKRPMEEVFNNPPPFLNAWKVKK